MFLLELFLYFCRCKSNNQFSDISDGIVLRVTLCFFCRRTPTTVMVRESHVERMGSIQDVPYEILNVLEFNR